MTIERVNLLPSLPARPIDGHKGTFGRVLVVGGSDGMVGAPVFAGISALRCGSGLVQIAVPRAILHSALSIAPELIGLGLGKGVSKDLIEAANAADVLVVGPGMGKSPKARARVLRLIGLEKAMILDADGLNILAAQKRWPQKFTARAILTPHPGEMKRLARHIGQSEVPIDDAGRIEIAIRAATAFRQIVVLKGHRTVITDGRRVYLNRSGDSTLSKAGSGDVLSGVIASLIGQGMNPFDAACAGVHLHGRAGEVVGKRLGTRCGLAMDVIDELPVAIRAYESEAG